MALNMDGLSSKGSKVSSRSLDQFPVGGEPALRSLCQLGQGRHYRFVITIEHGSQH